MSSNLWKIIEKYSYYPWDWNDVSMNPDITMNIIESHPEKPSGAGTPSADTNNGNEYPWNWATNCTP
jgi:hypothetical protein